MRREFLLRRSADSGSGRACARPAHLLRAATDSATHVYMKQCSHNAAGSRSEALCSLKVGSNSGMDRTKRVFETRQISPEISTVRIDSTSDAARVHGSPSKQQALLSRAQNGSCSIIAGSAGSTWGFDGRWFCRKPRTVWRFESWGAMESSPGASDRPHRSGRPAGRYESVPLYPGNLSETTKACAATNDKK